MRPHWRLIAGLLALAALIAVAVPLAAPGHSVVQAAGHGNDPSWLLGLYGDGTGVGGGAYFDLERVAFPLYLVVCLCASAIPARLLKGAIVALIAAFTLAPPLLSLDVFSYISYARLETLYDLNPYKHVPLERPGDAALVFIERWRDVTSAYGPLFTLGSLPLGGLGVGTALWVAKVLTGLATLALVRVVGRLAPARGLDPRPAMALVALNPLVLVHVVGGPHNDALTMLAATGGVAAVLGAREATGGAALLAAAAIKVSSGFIAPFALIGAAPRRGRLLFGAAAAGAAVAVASVAILGGGLLDSLAIAGENQQRTSRHSFPVTIAHDLGIGVGAVRVGALAAYALLIFYLLRWSWRGGDWVRAAGWAGLGLLLATSYLAPWYEIWVLPLAAISRDRWLVAGSLAFTGFVLMHQVPL
ncbi:MAG: glycosyltransferase 87 family protein [Solirubrobacterales bacterium]